MLRREILQAVALLIRAGKPTPNDRLRIGHQDAELQIAPVSPRTIRITILPLVNGESIAVSGDGSLVRESWGAPVLKVRSATGEHSSRCGDLFVKFVPSRGTLDISDAPGQQPVQSFRIDPDTGAVKFRTADGPLLGLGEGGPQFDRRGTSDSMGSGQGAYQLHTHGGRVPIPWVIGTNGWAIFFHQPYGKFDLTRTESSFQPPDDQHALPLDFFFVASREPAAIMREYARLTGLPQLPARWTFGYQQSHRTLASREEVLQEAKTFRQKKLPCDTLIYLGTGFCPSGWNTANGSFSWNGTVFPDPPQIIGELHRDNFKIVLHAVILSDNLQGSARDPCAVSRFDESQTGCYWDAHRKDFLMGVDGWWPDEGDPLDVRSRLKRNRMYWEGPLLDRPNERPFALHRNGYAGMQRYGAFLWSGDVYSTWETLRVHVPIAINTGLSGICYWGTDIGGFVPTHEFSAELYLRWFQFAAFTPLFRSHGRAWKLRLPWQWNSGETGPPEINSYNGAALPNASELHNPDVEPICRKYLDLRYRLLPYLYSAVRECSLTGMPVVRALWLHYSNDPVAVARSDQYLWGRDILVAPVVEKNASSRSLYLPAGVWFDFWTGERLEGGREIVRAVDLATMPLFVRAGAIVPFGPLKQYADQPVEAPVELRIFPGASGSTMLYDDDGRSFDYQRGEWMGVQIGWDDTARALMLQLQPSSRMLPPFPRRFTATINGKQRTFTWDGKPLRINL